MRKFRLKKIFPYIFFLVLLIIPSYFLTIDSLEVENKAFCFDTQKLAELKGKNFLFISSDVVNKEVTSIDFCVKSVSLGYQFPKKLKVTIEKRQPVSYIIGFEKLDLEYKVATSSSESALLFLRPKSSEGFIADSEGVIFEKVNSGNKFPLYWDQNELMVGQRLGQPFVFLVPFLQFLETTNLVTDIQFLKKINQDLLVVAKPRLVVSLKMSNLSQLASLQLILEKAKINGKEILQVDLRFDKPVVIYER